MSIFYIQKYREMVYFWRLWSTFAYTSWLWLIISPERNIHFWSNKKYLKEKTLRIFMIALSHFHWGSNNSPFSDPRPPPPVSVNKLSWKFLEKSYIFVCLKGYPIKIMILYLNLWVIENIIFVKFNQMCVEIFVILKQNSDKK